MTGPAGRGHSRHQGLDASAGSGGWRPGRSYGQGWVVRGRVQALTPAPHGRRGPFTIHPPPHCMLLGPSSEDSPPLGPHGPGLFTQEGRGTKTGMQFCNRGQCEGTDRCVCAEDKPGARQGGGAESHRRSPGQHVCAAQARALERRPNPGKPVLLSATLRDVGRSPLPGACPPPQKLRRGV